jgi:hypothetical protein
MSDDPKIAPPQEPAESADIWPLPKYSTGGEKHLHALGVITLNFNNFEFGLFRLFSHHLERMKVDIKIAWNLYSLLQDAKKTQAIEYIFSVYENDPIVIEHVARIIDYFNKCVTNRNHLFHSTHDHTDNAVLHLRAGVKGEWNALNHISISLPELRRIADEMFLGWEYLWDVWAFLQRRDIPNFLPPILLSLLPATLPKKPDVPVPLNPMQNPRTAT